MLKLKILLLLMLLPLVGKAATVVIGSKDFPESRILSTMVVLLLEKEGYMVEKQFNLLTSELRQKLIEGKIHLYWEYTGTGLRAILRKLSEQDIKLSAQPDHLFQEVKRLDRKNGVIWLNKSSLNNAYVLLTTRAVSQRFQLQTLEDLANLINTGIKLRFGMERIYRTRPEGFLQLSKHYGFKYDLLDMKESTHLMVYQQLKQGRIDIGVGFGTDPAILKQKLVILKDNKQFSPIYNAAPVVNIEFHQMYPRLVRLINQIGPSIDHQTMLKLNYLENETNQSVDDIAAAFLKQKGLL